MGFASIPDRMRANLDLGGGLIMAEAVMLDLGKTIGRQHAHDVVYDAAMEAAIEGKSFADLLAADQRVSAHLDAGRSTRCSTRPPIPVSVRRWRATAQRAPARWRRRLLKPRRQRSRRRPGSTDRPLLR